MVLAIIKGILYMGLTNDQVDHLKKGGILTLNPKNHSLDELPPVLIFNEKDDAACLDKLREEGVIKKGSGIDIADFRGGKTRDTCKMRKSDDDLQ